MFDTLHGFATDVFPSEESFAGARGSIRTGCPVGINGSKDALLICHNYECDMGTFNA